MRCFASRRLECEPGSEIWAAANQSRRVFSEMRASDKVVIGNGRNRGAESIPQRAFSELGAAGMKR
jgi:hypothetical protein